MRNNFELNKNDYENRNMILLSKIYQSFEALEKTLGQLQLEEPLFMTYAAKKSFTQKVLKHPKRDEKILKTRYLM
jgi:hypothetical protein